MAPRKTSTKKASESPIEEAAVPEVTTKAAPKAPKKLSKKVSCSPKPALNIRERPEMGAKVVGEIADGKEVPCEAAVDGWCKVEGGFVNADFLV